MSVLIPARNEELNIEGALESVRWANEVWVVDSNSGDRTTEYAERFGASVAQFDYAGHGPKKMNWALETLPFRNEWILILAADERVSVSLEDELAKAVASNQADGYYLDRELVFLGKSLRCFRPNLSLRLFKHRLGRFERLATSVPNTGDIEVHEHILFKGRTASLRSPLVNEDRRPIRAWVDNHNRYSEWEVRVYEEFLEKGPSVSDLLSGDPVWRKRALKRLWVRMPFRPLARFVRFYVVRRGFLDGREGFIYAVLMAFYEFLISVKLREFRKTRMRSKPALVDANTLR